MKLHNDSPELVQLLKRATSPRGDNYLDTMSKESVSHTTELEGFCLSMEKLLRWRRCLLEIRDQLSPEDNIRDFARAGIVITNETIRDLILEEVGDDPGLTKWRLGNV